MPVDPPKKDEPQAEAPAAEQPAAEAPAKAADKKTELKTVEFDGYKFQFDPEMLDDVELLEMIDAIESQGQGGVIIRLLRNLIGEQGYVDMKAYFVKKDGRFKMSKLFKIYEAIFEDFNPKG